jgi:hypothetical protein
MADDVPRRHIEVPEPPGGLPAEVARIAWRRAYIAERLAVGADDRSLAMFEALGSLQRDMVLRIDGLRRWIDGRFNELEDTLGRKASTAIKEVEKKVEVAEKKVEVAEESAEAAQVAAKKAEISSHDIQVDVDAMERAMSNFKPIDSERVRRLAEGQFEVLVSKQRLGELEEGERRRLIDQSTRSAEIRVAKLTTWGAIFSGIVLVIATYFFTRMTHP